MRVIESHGREPTPGEIHAIAVSSRDRKLAEITTPAVLAAQRDQLSPDELRALTKLRDTAIVAYFSTLELPPTPTVYDHLVLGLRPQDIFASFNWDPLLMMAHLRNRTVAPLPDIRFLHGCVALATCPKHDVLGIPGEGVPALWNPTTERPP